MQRTGLYFRRAVGALGVAALLLSFSPSDAGAIDPECGRNYCGWHYNETAEDLRDHWNHTGSFASSRVFYDGHHIRELGLSNLRLGGEWNARSLFAYRKGLLARQGKFFPDFDFASWALGSAPDEVAYYDGADGFQYGFGRSGPAGSLDIDLDWSQQDRYGDLITPRERAIVERATKLWAYGLKDVVGQWSLGPDQVSREDFMGWTNYPVRGAARAGDVLDGVQVVLAPMTSYYYPLGPSSGALGVSSSSYQLGTGWDGAFAAATGSVWLTSGPLTRYGTRTNVALTALTVHELGHVLGHANHNGGFSRYVSEKLFGGGWFKGPRTLAANGWLPVELQSDLSHNASCFSIMGYCHEKGDEKDVHVWRPQDVDFAVFTDMGYELFNPYRKAKPETYAWAGWGNWAAWGVSVTRSLEWLMYYDLHARDYLRAAADHSGLWPFAALSASLGDAGHAEWTGSLLGVDTHHAAFLPVTGKARLRVALRPMTASLHLSDLRTSEDGASRSFRRVSLNYHGFAVDDAGGLFRETASSLSDAAVEGGFYGPGHEEMAGTVSDPAVGLLAAFGGARERPVLKDEASWRTPGPVVIPARDEDVYPGGIGMAYDLAPGVHEIRALVQDAVNPETYHPVEGPVVVAGTDDGDWLSYGYWMEFPVGVSGATVEAYERRHFHSADAPGFGPAAPLLPEGPMTWQGEALVGRRKDSSTAIDRFVERWGIEEHVRRPLVLTVDVGRRVLFGRVEDAIEDDFGFACGSGCSWDMVFSAFVGSFDDVAGGRVFGAADLEPSDAGTPAFDATGGDLTLSYYEKASHIGFDAFGLRIGGRPSAFDEEPLIRYDVVGSFVGVPER